MSTVPVVPVATAAPVTAPLTGYRDVPIVYVTILKFEVFFLSIFVYLNLDTKVQFHPTLKKLCLHATPKKPT